MFVIEVVRINKLYRGLVREYHTGQVVVMTATAFANVEAAWDEAVQVRKAV